MSERPFSELPRSIRGASDLFEWPPASYALWQPFLPGIAPEGNSYLYVQAGKWVLSPVGLGEASLVSLVDGKLKYQSGTETGIIVRSDGMLVGVAIPPPPTGTAPTYITSNWDNNGSNTNTQTVNTTGSDAYLMTVSFDNNSSTPTISDSKSMSWTLISDHLTAWRGYTCRVQVYMAQGVSGSSGHTFTSSNTPNVLASVIGLATGGGTMSVDQMADVDALNTSPYVTSSITPTYSSTLAVAVLTPMNFSGDGATVTMTAPFVGRTGSVAGQYWQHYIATSTLTSTASVSATFTDTTGPGTEQGRSRIFNLVCN